MLVLDDCESLMHLPSNLADLIRLTDIWMEGCVQLGSLPRLPLSLRKLKASNCASLERIADDVDSFSNKMPTMYLANCVNLDGQSIMQINFAFKERIDAAPIVMWPGSEVPDWFVDKTLGASITIDLHSKPLKFSICLILSRAPISSEIYFDLVGRSCKIDDFQQIEPWYTRYGCHYEPQRLDSDNVYLFRGWPEGITRVDYPQTVSFRFRAKGIVLEKEVDKFKRIEIGIKACGVDILYAPTIDEECEVGCSYDNIDENKRVGGDELLLFPPTKRLKPFDLNYMEAECGVNLFCASASQHSFIQEGNRENLKIKGCNDKRAWGHELHLFPPSKRLKRFHLNDLEAE